MAPLEGTWDPAFAPVREAFAENFSRRGERGASVAISVEGRLVVDLWGGWRDEGRTVAWAHDTVVNVFSVGKAMAALCVLRLVSSGKVDLDQAVSELWPEFGAAGKGDVTIRCLLSHRAGLPGITEVLPAEAAFRRDRLVGALASQPPWWPPDSRHGYHANTYGLLLGEVLRRATGVPIADFFREEFAQPLELDFSFGLAPSKESRVAHYDFGPGGATAVGPRTMLSAEEALLVRLVYENPPGFSGYGTVNTAAWRAAEHPSANAHGNARSIASLYTALGRRGDAIHPGALLEEAVTEHSVGEDAVLGRPSRFGLGFQLTQPERPLGPNPASFGHFGAGGSLGFADPDAAVAFGYAMATYGHRWQDPRNRALIDALYDCL